MTKQNINFEDSTELYEAYILGACVYCPDIRRQFSGQLCVDSFSKKWVSHFSLPIYSAIYIALEVWRLKELEQTPTTTQNTTIIRPEALRSTLDLVATHYPAIIVEADIDVAVDYYTEILDTCDEWEARIVVGKSYTDWLVERRSKHTLTTYKNAKSENLLKALVDIREESNLSTKSTTMTFLDCESEDDDDIITRMALNVPSGAAHASGFENTINECLGGGFGKGEHVLFVAPSGGGKTVVACQIAANIALQQNTVLLVTTEQHPKELASRVLSNVCGISFDQIKNAGGNYKNYCNAEDYVRLKGSMNLLTPYLYFEDWSKPTGKTIATSLRDLVQKFKREHGDILDMVILDWIGGALGNPDTVDRSELTLIYKNAAAAMTDLAKDFSFAGVSLAQTSNEGAGKKIITEQHISTCRELHHTVTAGFGISAVRLMDTREGRSELSRLKTAGSTEVYDNRQTLNGFKCRKAQGKISSIYRDFAHQRFK